MSDLRSSGESAMHCSCLHKDIMRMFPFVISLLIILALPLHASQIFKQELRTFTADAGGVRLNGLLEESKIVDGKVTVKVPCIIFENPLKILDVRHAGSSGRREVDMVIAYHKLLIEGDVKRAIELWEPNVRKKKSRLLMDKMSLKNRQEYFKEHPGLTVIGLIFQKNTTSVLVDSDSGLPSVTLVNKADKLYFTDHPTNDLELSIVEASFDKEGGMYYLEQAVGGDVIKYSSWRKGGKLQLLRNPVFYTRGEGDKAVRMPTRPKNPIWQNVPDGRYKTITGITVIVKDSQIFQAIDRDGRNIRK